MADTSTYPGTLDGDLKALVPAVTPTAAEDFLELVADALSKVQAELGTDPAGASATVVARLGVMTTATSTAQSAADAAQADADTAVADAATAQSAADAAQADATAALEPTITANTQTSSYTLVLGDAGKVIEMNSASALNLTVPTNASVAFPVGTVLEVYAMGAGIVSIVAAGGVTIRSAGALLDLAGQYATASLRKRATDEWVLAGLLA